MEYDNAKTNKKLFVKHTTEEQGRKQINYQDVITYLHIITNKLSNIERLCNDLKKGQIKENTPKGKNRKRLLLEQQRQRYNNGVVVEPAFKELQKDEKIEDTEKN